MTVTPEQDRPFLTFLRSFAVYTVTVLWTALFWSMMLIPVGISLFFPRSKRQHFMRMLLVWFGRRMVLLMWRPFFRVRYEDLSGGAAGPGIVVVNHRAATDAFLIGVMNVCCAQTVNGWPMRAPVIGWGAKLAGYLNITGWDFSTLEKRAAEITETGDVIVAFPEGTRSGSTEMNPFHSGIFQIAIDLGLPVHMLCIAGNERMPDRKFRFREFRDLLVRRLPPVPAEDVKKCSTAFVLKKMVFQKIKDELVRMDETLNSNENKI